MPTTLNDVLKGNLGEEDEIEMRPDRIGGGKLITVKFGVGLNGKNDPLGATGGCRESSSTESSSVSTVVSRMLDTAAARRFLHWLADSLDTDTPNLEIEVVSENGNTQAVQVAARRLSEKAFG